MPCVFCGSPKTTKEHVFPVWLKDALPGEGKVVHEWFAPEGSDSEDRRWLAEDLSLVSRSVCQDRCNGGWMSDLEIAARPYLISMIQGRGRTLYRDGAEIVAHWALKTALMVDLAQEKEHRCVPMNDYSVFYEMGAVLPQTFVWLGACDFGQGMFARGRSLKRLDRPELGGYGATMHIGHLVIELIRVDGSTSALRLDGPLAEGLQAVWPWTGPISWPPLRSLTRRQVVAIPESTRVLDG